MAVKNLQMFLICCAIAAILNVANFFICYYIHVNKALNDNDWKEYDTATISPEMQRKLNILLECGDSSNCQKSHTNEMRDTDARDLIEIPGQPNPFYYDINDADLANIQMCPKIPPGLGPVEKDESIIAFNTLDEMLRDVKEGGIFKPMRCIPRQSVAIIIPMKYLHRSWKNYFETFLLYIHPFLMKQQSEYQIFVVIQGNKREPFARGKLLNTGFLEAQRMRRNGWDCLVFHDIHYMPTDTRNLYRCSSRPRRLITIGGNHEKFGGVVAIRPSQFKKVNGFSNLVWQNDGDYIHMFKRLRNNNYIIETNPSSIAIFATSKFFHDVHQIRSEQLLYVGHATTPMNTVDGLSNLRYTLVNAGMTHLFTFIEVDFQ